MQLIERDGGRARVLGFVQLDLRANALQVEHCESILVRLWWTQVNWGMIVAASTAMITTTIKISTSVKALRLAFIERNPRN